MYKEIQETAKWLRERMHCQPQTAIILGTGLGTLAEDINPCTEIPYKDIPHFPVSTVEGHEGKLIFGRLGGKDVIAMKGRFHYYEGYTMKEVTFPVRVMYELGVRTLFVSNAAGGANPSFSVGDIMVITDHINAFPENPLRGQNLPTGPRFPSMNDAYDKSLIALAYKVAAEQGLHLVRGTYYGVPGPSYETPAEYRAFHILGGDAVGMSTVPEVIVARHCGIKVFGLSVITNMGLTEDGEAASHDEVQAAAHDVQPRLRMLVKKMMERM